MNGLRNNRLSKLQIVIFCIADCNNERSRKTSPLARRGRASPRTESRNDPKRGRRRNQERAETVYQPALPLPVGKRAAQTFDQYKPIVAGEVFPGASRLPGR